MGKGKENCHRLERSFIHAVLNLSMPCALERDWGKQTTAGGSCLTQHVQKLSDRFMNPIDIHTHTFLMFHKSRQTTC